MPERLIVSDPAVTLHAASCGVSARRRVMMGKPIVKGTRITVELILEKLGAGDTMKQILDAHPRLTREGIQAALAFAAEN